MKILSITFRGNNKKKSVLNGRNTGYATLISLGATISSGIIKGKAMKKLHTPLSILTVLFSILHVGKIITYKN